MKYIVPKEINMISSNVSEENLPEWVTASYNTGNEVKVSADKKKYKFTGTDGTASTVTPSLDRNLWEGSPLNPYAMLADTFSTETTNPESIQVVLRASNIDTISLFNVSAKTVNMELKHNILTTELIAVGDGLASTFNYTTNVPPFEGFIEIWVNGVKEAEDIDANGVFENITGNYVSSGTINYATGEIFFTSLVANAQNIEVRYNAKIYSLTKSMTYDDIQSFGDYLYSEQELRDKLTGNVTADTLDLVIASMSEQQILDKFTANPPIYNNVDIYITILSPSGIAKCGHVVVGRKQDSGGTLYGLKIGLKTTSKRVRNSWGEVEFSLGSTYDILDIPIFIKSNQVDVVKSRLHKVINKPCVFIGDDTDNITYQSTVIYGFFFDLEIPIDPTITQYNLRVESLI